MKTIEQEANKYTSQTEPIKCNPDCGTACEGRFCSREVANAFIAGVEFAQQWIPVEEALPEEGRVCLTKNEDSQWERYSIGVYNAHFNKFQDLYNVYAKVTIEKVTHWRYIELK